MDQKGSPGFMYYSLDANTDSKEEQRSNQSSDYISLDTFNQSQGSDLNQSYYSSPSASYSISSGNRTPYKNTRGRQKWSNNRGGRNRGNYNSPRGGFHNRSNFNNSNSQQKDNSDCSIYLHESFTEDPWKNLERFNQYHGTEGDSIS